MDMDARLHQELRLTPQVLQSIELLKMNSVELLTYINGLMAENPVLEQEDRYAAEKRFDELRERADWIGASLPRSVQEGEMPWEPGSLDRETESLSSFLRDQLGRQKLSKSLLALTEYLVELLDEDGYLTQEDLDDMVRCRIPEDTIRNAVDILQSLDPPGIGARSLSECLLLQLSRRHEPPFPANEIIARFLPDLAKKRYSSIAKKLGVSLDDVFAAEKLIGELEPHPGRAFSAPEAPVCVLPDIYIFEADGKWNIALSDYYLPRIYISDTYLRTLREVEDEETRVYLRDRIQQAKWLMRCMSQRGQTLYRCAEWILQTQKAFFFGATTELKPCGQTDLAKTLGLHPSTVSRAVHGKYLQCRQGVFPLQHFFSRSVSEGISRQAAKQKLLSLLQTEPRSHPYSDQRLCELLSRQGIFLSRRAVAKYRLELGVASSSARRKV